MNETEFVDCYEDYAARRIARDLYRAMNPIGMHTNGPTRFTVEASLVLKILSRWTAEPCVPSWPPRQAKHDDLCHGVPDHIEVGRGYQRCRLCGKLRE